MNWRYIGVVAASLCVGGAVGFGTAQVAKPDLAQAKAAGVTNGSLSAVAQGKNEAAAASVAASSKASEDWKTHRPTTTVTSTRTQWTTQ
jgi:hypothetical protein